MTTNTDSTLKIVKTVTELRQYMSLWRADGKKTALVPTMGALHAGHLSLVRLAQKHADHVIASIFVNPKQFAAHEDLDSYPRHEEDDIQKLKDVGCSLAYLPTPDQIYPDGFSTRVTVEGLSEGLCGQSRPHFFGGVATIVTKLLGQCQADYAIFGEKDYQQLLIIQRLAKDLDIQTEIISGPIIREEDGLAMSSRNQYLNPQERALATEFARLVQDTAAQLRQNISVHKVLTNAQNYFAQAGLPQWDYLEIRDKKTLEIANPDAPLSQGSHRLFAAIYIGKTRLIDNVEI
ncbi:MAG: pantoate--beta-alanine ligase [bacterium]